MIAWRAVRRRSRACRKLCGSSTVAGAARTPRGIPESQPRNGRWPYKYGDEAFLGFSRIVQQFLDVLRRIVYAVLFRGADRVSGHRFHEK